jgi:hypothetical protein
MNEFMFGFMTATTLFIAFKVVKYKVVKHMKTINPHMFN